MTTTSAPLDDAARARLALEAFGTGIWDWHVPSGELYLSPNWKAQLGFDDAELPNAYRTWEGLVHPNDLPGVLARLHAYLDGNIPSYDAEFRMRGKDGQYRWIRARGQVTERDQVGQPVRLIGIHDDITRQKEAELALRRSEDKFVNLFDLSPDAIGISRLADGRLAEVNRALEEMTGYRREELIGTSTLNLWVDANARAKLLARVERDLDVASEIHRFQGKDGRVIDGLVSIRRIEHEGEPHLLFVVRDVSTRIAAETRMRESEARYREAQRMARLGHWSFDVNSRRFLWWSDEMFELMEADPAQGCPDMEQLLARVHPDDRGLIEQALGTVLATGRPLTIRPRVLTTGDAVRYLEVNGIPVIGTDGRITSLTGTTLDITERVQAAMEIENRARETEWLMKSMGNAFIVWGIGYDAAGKCNDLRFEYFNDAYSKTSGLSFADVQGKSIHEIWPDAEPEWFEIYGRVAHTGEPEKFERYFISTGGWYACTAYRPWAATDRICVVFDDITERKRMEQALRDSEARWQFALEGAGAGVWDWNISANTLFLAPGWKALLGYQDYELANEYATWASRVHPDDLPGVEALLGEYLSGRRAAYDVEFRMRAKGGDDIWIRARGKIVERDADGAPIRMIGVHDDITARKQAEFALQRRIIALTRPLGGSEDIQFSELLNLDDIQELQDLFADAFGVASLITTPEGVPITRPSHFSHLCGDLIRKNAEGVKRCEHSDAILGRHNPHGPNIQHCLSAGLCNAGASISVGGRHVANWLIGQVRDETHNDHLIIRFAKDIGADASELVQAFHDIPRMPREQFERIARILYVMANQISTMAYQNVQQARFIAERYRAEESLRTFQALAEASVDAIVMASPEDAVLTFANPAAHEMFACDAARQEMVGLSGRDFWPVEDRALLARVLEQALDHGWRGDVRQIRRDGGVFDANATVFALRDAEGKPNHIVAIIRDIGERKRAEAALKRSELTYREIFNSVNDCIWVHDIDTFEFVDVNDVVTTMFGYSHEEAMTLGVADISSGVWPYSGMEALEYMRKAVAGEPQVFEWHCRHKDGHLFWTEVSLKRGQIAGTERILAIERDITARKLAESALRMTQFSVDHATEAIFWFDRQGRFNYVNDGACRLLGYDRDALLRMSIPDVDTTIAPEALPAIIEAQVREGSVRMESILRRKDGSLVDVAITSMFLSFDDRDRLVAHIRDISEQKRAEQALRREKHFSDALVDGLPGIFYLFDDQSRLVRWNRNLLEITGLSDEQLATAVLSDFVVDEDREHVLERVREVFVKGESLVEARLRSTRAETPTYLLSGIRLHDAGRDYLVGFGVDISERKRAEEALRLIRFGVERSSDAIYLIDANSRFLDVNEAACRALNYDKDTLLGMSIMDIDPGVSPEIAAAMFQALRDTGRLHVETQHRRRDGTLFPVEINANYIQFVGKEYNFCYARDIRERKAAEAALRLSEARFRAVIDNVTEVISILDADGVSRYQSPALKRVYGYEPDEFIGRNGLSLVHPDDQAKAGAHFAALLASPGKMDTMEYRYRHAGGGWIDVESNAVALLDDPAIGGVLISSRDISARKRADAALHLTRRAIDVAALAFEWYDERGRIVDVNAKCCQDLGYSREELLQLRLCDIDPDFPAEVWPDIWKKIRASGSLTTETTHRRKDGSLFPVVVTANYVEYADREYIFTYAQDVTERNRVERQLKATQHAIDHASVAFEWLDAAGQVISCNIQAHRALGYERGEFIGMRVWDYDPDMSPETWLELWEVLRREGHATLETRHRRKDGHIFPIEVTVNHGVFGADEYCFAYITDISERKAAEERLRFTQFAVDSSSIAFLWGGEDGRIIGCNHRAHESLGLSRDELIGMHVWDFDPDFSGEGVTAHWTAIKQAGKLTFETRHRHRDGHVFPVEVTTNLGEFDGHEYAFSYVVDITERKAADEHLRLIQQAVDRSSVAFEWLGIDGRVISGNIQAYESLGYTLDEFVKMFVWDFTPGLSEERWRRHITELRERGSEFVEGEHRRKDGTVFPIEVRANYVKFGEQEYIFSYINDITERKAAELALRNSERRLAELFDFLPDATFAIDTQGAVIAWNRAMETMSGVGKADVLGKSDRAYAEAFYGQKRPMLIDLIFDYDESIASRYDYVRKDGDALVTEDQTAYLYGNRRIALWGKAAPLRDAEGRFTGAVEVVRDITEQKDAERELRLSAERFRSVVSNTPVLIFEFDDEGVFKLSEGRGLQALGMEPGQLVHTSVCEFFHDDAVVCGHIQDAIKGETAQFTARVGKRVFETYFNPVIDARSKRVSVIGVAVDITERTEREAELQQKTDEMTRFNYTVSHDLKSPLVTIRTFLGFLEQDIQKQDAERIAKDMGFIRNASDKMTRLLEELLELSRIGRLVNNPVDIVFRDLAREALALVAGRIAERGVDTHVDAVDLIIHGDHPRLVEVFQNLIDNAVKFMGDQPEPRIDVGVEARDGEWVFHVRDNGMGIDPRHLHKLFGLFEKLDPNAEGTGIGLTLVKRIVEIHGGRIWVESAGPGTGTTFFFTLGAVRGVN
jgi:PAS domain S-box-containing protein